MSEPDNSAVVRSFSRLVATQERGDLDNDLSIAIADIVKELEAIYGEHRGKPKATLSLTFTFTKDKNGITVQAQTTRKLPQPPRAAQVYFATDKNLLTTRDPSQPELPLRDVSAEPRQARDL